jgi:quinohemoprotein ethanol dehydrogenase
VSEEALYKEKAVVVWPGTYGVHNWPPMSFNRKTGLVYVPAIHQADAYSSEGVDESEWEPTPGTWNTGMGNRDSVTVPKDEFGSSLLAWDPKQQKPAWRVTTPGTWNGGTMSTAGGLVFQGHIDGTLNAFDADTGKRLWSFNAGVSVLGAPITYRWQGVQYITVLAGPPSGSAAATLMDTHTFGWRYRAHPRRILTFVLNGSAELPPGPPPKPEEPLKAPGFEVDPDKAKAGNVLFDKRCGTCHGYGVIAGGAAPELRASPIPLDETLFEKVVRGDMMLESGMPVYPELSDEDLEALRHYIRREANRDDAYPALPASSSH